MRRGLLLLVLLVFASSCAGGEDARTVVWFTTDDGSLRSQPRDVPPRPREALRALLSGPTPSERDAGMRTDLPTEIELLGATLRSSTVQVYLRGERLAPYEPNTVTFALRLSQLVYTLTDLPQVERVRLFVNGKAWGFATHSGERIRTYTRETAPFVCGGTIWTGEPPARCAPG